MSSTYSLRAALTGLLALFAISAWADDLAANRSWSDFGGTPGGGQYSALDHITRENVGGLKLAWTHRNGDAARFAPGGKVANYEVTPILAEGSLFICTQFGRVLALDPKTGREKWAFDPFASLIKSPVVAGTCRGVAYWHDQLAQADSAPRACLSRIFLQQYGGRLIVLDAKTGQPCSDFGKGGMLDMSTPDHGGTGHIRFTSPPSILKDTIIVAGSVGDNIRANQPDGVIRAFDARTGMMQWRLVTIPESMSDKTGNADVWPPYSVDVERNLVFIPTGSPSPDFYGVLRNDPIPYANALLAIDVATGQVKWHYQIVHHDLLDYDLPAQPIVADITRAGRKVPAVIQITKMGTIFVFNRETGEPLFPIEEVAVPASDIPGEMASPTQPRPVKPEPFSSQIIKEKDIFGLTFWDRGKCRESFKALRYEGPFTPPSLQGSLTFPASTGGGNWGGAAYDPVRNRLIVKAQNLAFTSRLFPIGDPNIPNIPETAGSRVMEGTPYYLLLGRWLSPFGVPCNPPPWGELVAIDLDSGDQAWRRPVGQVPFGPFNILKSPAAWGSPIVGGPMITAGGLIFMAATFDPVFRAFDIDTGKELWSTPLPSPAMAVPMTYEFEGQQYVVIAAGGSILAETELSDEMFEFELPSK